MGNEKKYFEQLVIRYLNGQLEDQEYDELLHLLQDQEKASWFYSLKNSWEPERNNRSLKNWKRLARRIHVDSTKAPGSENS